VLICAAAGLLACLALASSPRGPRIAQLTDAIKANSEIASETERLPLEVAPLFGSHMVLPAGVEVKLFGWAKPKPDDYSGGKVLVQFVGGEEFWADVEYGSWRWEVTLPPREISMTPVEISISKDLDSITLTDVVFGELYLCVGASNVDFRLDWATDAATALEETKTFGDRVRITKVKKQEGKEPMETFVPQFGWQQAQNDNNTAEFSALCYFFGLEQTKRHSGTPVGLIQASFGATASWQWAPQAAIIDCESPVDEDAGHGPFWEPKSTSVLWYGMMSPWSALNVKSLILNLQGDTCIMPFMVKRWREAWVEKGNEEPAVAVAQFGCNTGDEGDANEVTQARIDQMHFLEVDRTVLVSTSDFCDPASPYAIMHSPFKREEAGRLAGALEALLEGNEDMPEAFPVPTAVYTDPWDDSWGAWGSKECSHNNTRTWGIRVEFDQDLDVKPEFKALFKKFPHINGFTLYPSTTSGKWNVSIKLEFTEIRGNTVVLNTTLSSSQIETDDPWPGQLVYADGAFPVTPLTNLAGQPVGTFKVAVPLELGYPGDYTMYAQGPWSPASRQAYS
jgi:hypothetical protein